MAKCDTCFKDQSIEGRHCMWGNISLLKPIAFGLFVLFDRVDISLTRSPFLLSSLLCILYTRNYQPYQNREIQRYNTLSNPPFLTDANFPVFSLILPFILRTSLSTIPFAYQFGNFIITLHSCKITFCTERRHFSARFKALMLMDGSFTRHFIFRTTFKI